uniref:Uncharacterized protein n=2 Tax=Caenorhabditis japonica TaxID=281687 RepID=A0A8R1EWK2_CAEJA
MILFHVQNARGCKDLPFFMKDPIFGVLHTPQAFRIRRMPEQLVYNDAWVTLNYCHPGDALLPPAKFALCPVGENPDDTAVPVAEVADSELDDAEENPEDRIEFARNRADVPPVFAAVNENELE